MNGALFPIAGPLTGELPWDVQADDQRRFRRVLFTAMAFFVVFAVLVPVLPVQEIVRDPVKPDDVPLAKIVLEPKQLPEQRKPEPKQKTTPKPPPEPVVKPKPVPVPPQPEVVKTPPKPKPVDPVKKAREAAAAAGLLAFKDDLQAMRDSVDVSSLNRTQTRRGEASAAETSRDLIASKAPTASGGIKTDELSTDTGGPALSGRETVAVRSALAGDGSSRGHSNDSASQNSERVGGRSDDAIRRVMDTNKGAIFAIYNRALRSDPLLEGKLVFEMVIEPDGAVSSVDLLSSDLGDTALTRKILSRIRLIGFGAANVQRTRVNYSFDFLPHM